VPDARGTLRSRGTGDITGLEAGLVLRSVGYRGVPLADVPFDPDRGVIPNVRGRVTEGPGGPEVPGEYVAGWIKRGPTGIIGTNKPDAAETVASMLEELAAGLAREPAQPEPAAVPGLLRERRVPYVTLEGWKRLDAAERAAGRPLGRPRVKVVRVEEMLAIIDEEP
jgi:ferredoxin--NADP+ reductase